MILWNALFGSPTQIERPKPNFIDLAPTSNADSAGIYFDALRYAISNPDVRNIALTGPYGSGKSSVIRSFVTQYGKPVLHLSLASFIPDDDVRGHKASKQEIERSILQQILYGADADRLPLSRFKRIQTPQPWSLATSLFATLGVIAVWYLFNKQSDILSGKFFDPQASSNWFNFLCLAIGAVAVWRLLHYLYIRSFGVSLKSVSLKDIEISPDTPGTDSILNRHLDEIIYFFQSTSYDLVVIEDLDRFDTTDIFVTLRELNGLINANSGVKRAVRFLYALRDDIFVNTDRTKFFEFIVPIVPVINHSNSIDKILEQAQRLPPGTHIDRQFLRDVSRYLDDMRLIRNIFNEYLIYSANLGADDASALDPNKLLAVLIYKNVMPHDFADLHRQDGILSKLLARYDAYISVVETGIRSQIAQIDRDLLDAEHQLPRDMSELRKIYAMSVIERLPDNHSVLHFGSDNIPASRLATYGELEKMMSTNSVTSSNPPYAPRPIRVDLSGIEASVDPARTFSERTMEIERKAAKYRQQAANQVRTLKGEIASLRGRKFNEVIRENADITTPIFDELGASRDLLKFLVFDGHLDDTYYQYISLFHAGRLSPNDNRFLVKIRSYNTPDPDYLIDNPAEVIASMRSDDFGLSYVLNWRLFDYLIAHSASHPLKIAAAITHIATNFDECDKFFASYYEHGSHIDRFIPNIMAVWPDFIIAAVDTAQAASHVARILAYSSSELLSAPAYATILSRFISQNTLEVLSEQVSFDLDQLNRLRVDVEDIQSISGFSDTVRAVLSEALYQISVDNIRYVVRTFLGWPDGGDLDRRNYSVLLQVNDATLLNRIDRDFERYVTHVLLALEGNTNEDALAIVRVLGRDDVEQTLREEFLRRQTTILPSLEDVPDVFYAMLFAEQKIKISWDNCLAFIASDTFDEELLTSYLQVPGPQASLSQQSVPDGETAAELRRFLRENDRLELSTYRSYIRVVSEVVDTFPDVSTDKIKALIEEGKVAFAEESFKQLDANQDLQVLFAALNFDAYWLDPTAYADDDVFLGKLLRSRISDPQRLAVIGAIEPASISADASLAATIGAVLGRSTIVASGYGSAFVIPVVVNSRPVSLQVSLLNKLHLALTEAEVRDVLQRLPNPFADIANYGRSPRIENTEVNQNLVRWLEDREIISSFTTTLESIRVNTFRKA